MSDNSARATLDPESYGKRVRVDGKFFAKGRDRFPFRGVTYGTFAPRADGLPFGDRDTIKGDFAAIREAGFSVVRTYTVPPDDLLDLASDWGLHVLAGVFAPDWRYLVGASRRARAAMLRQTREVVRDAARRLADDERVLGLCLGNEIPADVVRWFGERNISTALDGLIDVVREEDPEQLVTYANYPTAEYLSLPNLDFVTFNVFLEQRADLRRYLTRLHNIAGDRPLVLGELGLHAGDSVADWERQAEVVDWQLETAVERGVAGTCVFAWTDDWWVGGKKVDGWSFGLTTEDREPRPALDVVSRWNNRTVRDLDVDWPSLSVVVCAYNAALTLDECLSHTCDLDYPELEIIVVDDGSTDATADIARRYDRVQLVEIPHGGLSVARNAGLQAATGAIVAYLDSDAYPSPEWPYYLVLAFDRANVGGAGGPNIPPVDDPVSAHVVAHSPGGPVHVLLTDDRAEHVPGCNMAFWRFVLEEVGGCDPIYTSAGDDVDLCWKVLDRDWQIAFHPAALVWHHRRPGFRPYLRQQEGYGRSEALVEARHPDRFTPLGTARWRGRIYNSFAPAVVGQRIYRGEFGAAAFQSVYRGGGHLLDLLHQVGLPIAAVCLPLVVLGVINPAFLVVPAAAALFIGSLATVDVARARPPHTMVDGRLQFRLRVAAHHLAQPMVRTWGRMRNRRSAYRALPQDVTLPSSLRRLHGATLLCAEERPRPEITHDAVEVLRRTGRRVMKDAGWDAHDARVECSALVDADLVTSAHPEGSVQLRLRARPQPIRAVVAATVAVLLAVIHPGLVAGWLALVALDVGVGVRRSHRSLPTRLLEARAPVAPAPTTQ